MFRFERSNRLKQRLWSISCVLNIDFFYRNQQKMWPRWINSDLGDGILGNNKNHLSDLNVGKASVELLFPYKITFAVAIIRYDSYLKRLMQMLLSYKPSKLAMRRSHRIEAITHIISTLIIVAPNKQHFNRKLLILFYNVGPSRNF